MGMTVWYISHPFKSWDKHPESSVVPEYNTILTDFNVFSNVINRHMFISAKQQSRNKVGIPTNEMTQIINIKL